MSNLLRLIIGEEKDIEVEDSFDGSSSGIIPSFVLTDSDSADEILSGGKPSDGILDRSQSSIKIIARKSISWQTKQERSANTGIVRWKDQQEYKDGENTSNKGYIENSSLVAINQSYLRNKAPLDIFTDVAVLHRSCL